MPRRSKVTFRLNILFNFTVYNIKYTVAEALPPPETVSEPPLFCVGALVRTIPDTRPGIGPEHSVTTYGTVVEARAEGGWLYRVKSAHTGRKGPWVPKERVMETSKSLFDNAMLETRAFPVI